MNIQEGPYSQKLFFGFKTEGLPFSSTLLPMVMPNHYIFAGRYSIHGIVGVGASAIVYSALDFDANSEVALKVYYPSHFMSVYQRYSQREMKVSIKVSHPNLLKIFDFQIKPTPHLVMEYAQGGSLRQRMDQPDTISLAAVIDYTRQILQALEALHNAGILHRDVKAENSLLDHDSKLKLGDFGIATCKDWTTSNREGRFLGTPRYMAPETIKKGQYTRASDLYAVGVLLRELLVRSSHNGEKDIQARLRVVPQWIKALMKGLLERNPEKRIRSAREAIFLLEKR